MTALDRLLKEYPCLPTIVPAACAILSPWDSTTLSRSKRLEQAMTTRVSLADTMRSGSIQYVKRCKPMSALKRSRTRFQICSKRPSPALVSKLATLSHFPFLMFAQIATALRRSSRSPTHPILLFDLRAEKERSAMLN